MSKLIQMGASLGVIIPKAYICQLGLERGDDLTFALKDGVVEIRPDITREPREPGPRAATKTLPQLTTAQIIERQVSMAQVPEIVDYLLKALGRKSVVYLSLPEYQVLVDRWQDGSQRPSELAEIRLRYAYHAMRLIEEAHGIEVAAVWLGMSNSNLSDRAPTTALHFVDSAQRARRVVRAAREFARDYVPVSSQGEMAA